MGVFNNFSNRFRLGDDDEDYEDDDLDEYEDEDEEDSRGRGLFNRKKNYDEDDEDDYEPQRGSRSAIRGSSGDADRRRTSSQVPQQSRTRSAAPAPVSSKMQVRIIKPSSFDQARQITDTLLAHRTVLLNLEGLDVNTAQRIVDFASGSCYALHGNFMKISHFIIVITPEDVDIAGDVTAAAGAQEAAAAGIFAGAAAQQARQAAGGMNGMGGASAEAGNPFAGSMGTMNGMNGMNGGF